jgi:RHS repeat-associated protein
MAEDPNDYWFKYDWDGRLSSNKYCWSDVGIEAKYTPDEGIRVYKNHKRNLASYEHKYIVDATGDFPQILLIIDANSPSKDVIKTHIHAHNQVIAQHDGDYNDDRYFYLHDRLGSVRLILDSAGNVNNCYYYTPFGGTTGSETEETVSNWYAYAGYFYDDSTGTYYCNARQYDFGRFTTRDPVRGTFKEPLTLHPYLYCLNDPVNKTDPSGEFVGSYIGIVIGNTLRDALRNTQYAYYAKAIAVATGVTIDLTTGYLTFKETGKFLRSRAEKSPHKVGRDPNLMKEFFDWFVE